MFFFATLVSPIPLILNEIQVWEVPLYISFLIYLSILYKNKPRLNSLDKLIFYYFILSSISVFSDFDTILDSMQMYRWTVIPPVIIYMMIRSQCENYIWNTTYFKIMLPGILLYSVFFIQNTVSNNFSRGFIDTYGTMRVISLAYVFSLGIAIVLYLIKRKLLVKILMLIILFIALIFTFTRAMIFGAILTSIFIYLISIRKKYRVNLYSKYIVIGVFSFFVLIINYSAFESNMDKKELREIQKSSNRLVNLDVFKEDINDRLRMWASFLDLQPDHTLLVGKGLSHTTIGFEKNLNQYYASSHNFLISFFRRSGILGVLLVINIIITGLKYSFSSLKYSGKNDSHEKVILYNILILFFLGFTNDLFTGNRISYLFLMLGFTSNSFMRIKDVKRNPLYNFRKK